MENYNVYQDIANRTGGDIYVGVVGPVRTGKSTFIKRFMETLVLPNAAPSEKTEMIDELPQSAAGKTIMTTEPKFVPSKAAKITVSKGAEIAVRLVDCVGFCVEGASGFEEDGVPRLVKTPWQENPMPFEEAAALGTQKVIDEHATIGVLVTTDGSITEIERNAYVQAEERAVHQLKRIGKPFVIVLNCQNPDAVGGLKQELENKYQAPVVAMNVENMQEQDVRIIMQTVLFEFPLCQMDVRIPKWLQTFPESNPTIAALIATLQEIAPKMKKMRDCQMLETLFAQSSDFLPGVDLRMDLGKGAAEITLETNPDLFYKVLSDVSGQTVQGELELMQYVCALAQTKQRYDKIKDAFTQAEEHGYGIVCPTMDDYQLEQPKLVKKGASYGACFRANAPSYHVVKVTVNGTVNPVIGSKEQSVRFIDETKAEFENDMENVWETNIFGNSLRTLVDSELSGKAKAMPIELRKKMRRTVSKIVNEGKNNVVCFLF